MNGYCGVWFDAKFKFPENDMEQFNKYYHYANTIKELLDDEWNFDRIREKFPPKTIMVMNDKIDEILKIIKQENCNG